MSTSNEASQRAGAWSLRLTSTSCGCRWVWFRRTLDGGLLATGCPRHSQLGVMHRERVTSFHVKPEPGQIELCGHWWAAVGDDPWCRRGGGVASSHVCDRTADDHGKRCRCTCGAVE